MSSSVDCEKERLQQNEFFKVNVKISFIFWIHLYISTPRNYFTLFKVQNVINMGQFRRLGQYFGHIGHIEKKISYEHLSNSKWLLR